MKGFFVLLFSTLCLMGSQAKAQNAFETLRDAFDRAPAPATVQDFEFGRWHSCVFSDVATPHQTRSTQVRTLQYMTGPGQGPLFPGDNDYRIDVFSDYSIDRNLVAFFQSSRIEHDGVNFRQVLDGPPWRRMNVYGRVDTNMLLFHVEVSDFYGYRAPMYARVYGYCWNPAAPATPIPDHPPLPEDDDGGNGEIPLPIPAPQ